MMGWAQTLLAALQVVTMAACGRIGFDATVALDDATVELDDGAASGDATSCSVLAGLVVHLPFDEGSGEQTADVSGRGNHGQLSGATSPAWATGRMGSALAFDGVDDRVDAGSAIVVDDVRPLTLCAWILPRSYPNEFPAIVDKSADTFIGGWNFYIEDNGTFGFLTNREKWATGGSITLDTWQHVCVAWDGSTGTAGIVLYEDGASISHSDSGSNGNALDSDAGHQLLIGRVNNGTYPFDGVIDDVRLYNRVLDAQEIAAIYACAP